MLHTYKAILRGDRLEWVDDLPKNISTDVVSVYVTVLDESAIPVTVEGSGPRMAAVLEQLAAIHALADLTDPAAWEREIRQDRSLPDRDR